jgi:hypothetical protein
VNFGVDSWSDGIIVVTFNPQFQNEYDLKNITLVVVAANGQSAQLAGNEFIAAREKRPLTMIPTSLFSFTTDPTGGTSKAYSPLNGTNFSSSVLATAQAENWSALIQKAMVLSNYLGFNQQWITTIDLSKLRTGFIPNAEFQTSALISDGSCQSYDVPVSGSLVNRVLRLTEQPQQCDDGGKFANASYGLMLSVTGPKGNLLNPWPDGLQ